MIMLSQLSSPEPCTRICDEPIEFWVTYLRVAVGREGTYDLRWHCPAVNARGAGLQTRRWRSAEIRAKAG